jgi:dipeptidyl-peptidase-4
MKKFSPFVFSSFLIVNLLISSVFAQTGKKELTLNDVFKSRKFYASGVYGMKPLNDGEHFCMMKKDSLNIYSYKTGEYYGTIVTSQQLIPEGDTTPIPMYRYQLSKDEKKILFSTKTESIYRRSSISEYYVWDSNSDKLMKLSDNGKQRLATFSPDGSKVAFVRDNNLFIKDFIANTEKQVTNDGLRNNVINGATDWVYEEEFSFSKAFFWSPDGNRIAFYRFDESNVKEFQFTEWGDLYPKEYKYKYPKAGEDNSVIKILVYNLDSDSTTEMDIGSDTDIYIPRIKWTNDPSLLAIQWMNRLQNNLKILLTDVTTGANKVIYDETNKYYIDITDNLTFFEDNKQFIFTSEMDGYNHIYLYSIDGELINQVTKGEWDVTSLKGVDEEKGLVYFTSAEISPLNRELYVVKLNGKGKKKLSDRDGTNRPVFSKSYKYYVNTYSSATTPSYITVNEANGKVIRVLKDNSDLLETLAEYDFSFIEFFKFTTSEGVELNGWMIKPPGFNPDKKYPVLMNVYGGPGSQTVKNSWRANMWNQMLAQKGIILVSVDNRGTGARGEEFKKMTYLQLGKYETIDQIEAAKYLGSLNYVDSTRIGIWGWSYGGYMSSLCITKGADYFSMAIAVAPVTNWRYYDNIYTERFMRTPQENPDGYDDNSPINYVSELKGKYLIVHGTADDNVHLQNTMDMVTALDDANKQFEMQLYPNSNHGIYTGRNTTMHLYTRLTNFITDAFLKK